MNPALAGVALAITVGAIVAVSTRDARAAVLGLAVAMIGAPILADPMADTDRRWPHASSAPSSPSYLLWIAVRDGEGGDRRVAARLGGGGVRRGRGRHRRVRDRTGWAPPAWDRRSRRPPGSRSRRSRSRRS